MATEYDRLKTQKDAIEAKERRAFTASVAGNETLLMLSERMKWYREGCEGLEDREGYYASGDVARDAASDLETAISEIRVLENVIAKMRAHLPTSKVVTIDAVKSAIGFLNMPQREMVLDRLGEGEEARPQPTHGNARCKCGHLSDRHACDHERADSSCFDCKCEHFAAAESTPKRDTKE